MSARVNRNLAADVHAGRPASYDKVNQPDRPGFPTSAAISASPLRKWSST